VGVAAGGGGVGDVGVVAEDDELAGGGEAEMPEDEDAEEDGVEDAIAEDLPLATK